MGEENAEGGADAKLALNFNLAMMSFYDAIRERESQPGSFADRLGREEGFEQVGLCLGT